MGSIKSLSGIEMLKRLDDRLHIYSSHIKACSRMQWICRSSPRWVLGVDMLRTLNDIFGDIYIYNGLKGILDPEKAEGIAFEDGKAIQVVIKHCLECPFSFGAFCHLGQEYWGYDDIAWAASGYLIPGFCPLQQKQDGDIGEYEMDNKEKQAILQIHTELAVIRDIILKLLADLKSMEGMDLGVTIGDCAEANNIKGLVTKAVNGIAFAFAIAPRPTPLPTVMIADLFQEMPKLELGEFLNRLYLDYDEDEDATDEEAV